jgi:phosphotransferase system enzyme I (PtsP)
VRTFQARFDAERKTARRKLAPETLTSDGARISLLTNINLLSDMKLAMQLGCEGVGLYRTEFPFLIRNDFPSEEEQYAIYRRIVETARGKEIVFRTLDIGGDKMLSYFQSYREANPFLGMRSIRFSLDNPRVFRAQIRAILRACGETPATIMFPMISSLDEFLSARDILTRCVLELAGQGYRINQQPQIGLMVEVPSIVEIIHDLARHADFFSIGTNDFVQYMLGVDRANEKVASFYTPHHPSVLRSLQRIVRSAMGLGREVSVCGEMAHQRAYLAFLIGIGVRKFSMDAGSLPDIQQYVEGLSLTQAESYAADLLSCVSVKQASERLASAPGL